MPIPTIVEADGELPEGLADYYEQDDEGRYVLSVEGVDNHPDVRGLKTSLQKQKQDREKLRKERDQYKETASMIPEDMDRETLQDALERIRNGASDQGQQGQGDQGQQSQQGQQGQQQDVAKVRKQLEDRFQKEIEKRDQNLEMKDKQVRNLVVDNTLGGALQKNGVSTPGLQKAAKRLLSDQIKVQEDDNGMPQAVVDTDMGEVSVDQFVKDWINTEEGQDFLPKSSGSGARGSGAGSRSKREVAREQFDQMSAEERQKFIRDGGKITG